MQYSSVSNFSLSLFRETCARAHTHTYPHKRTHTRREREGERERERIKHEMSDSESLGLKDSVSQPTWTYRCLLHFWRGLAMSCRQSDLNEGVYSDLSSCSCRVGLQEADVGTGVEWSRRGIQLVGGQRDWQEWGRWWCWDRGMHFQGIWASAAAGRADRVLVQCVHLGKYRLQDKLHSFDSPWYLQVKV